MGNDMSSMRKSEVVYKVERTPDQTTYSWHGKKHFVPPKVDNATPTASQTTPNDPDVESCPFCAGVVYANEHAEGQQPGVGPKASSFSQSASAKIKVFHSKKADKTDNGNATYGTESLPKNFNVTTYEENEKNVAYKNKKDFYDQFQKEGSFPENKSATWSKQVTPGNSTSQSKISSPPNGEATKPNGTVFVEDLFPSIRPTDRTTSFHTSNASSSYVGESVNGDGSDVEVEEGEINEENAQKQIDLENSNWKEENLCAKHKHLNHWFRQGHYGQSVASFRKEIENLIAKKDSGVHSPNDSFESDKKDTLPSPELDLNGRNRITSADSGVSTSVFPSPSADNTNQFQSLSTNATSSLSPRKRSHERSHEEIFEDIVESMDGDKVDDLEAAFSCFEKTYHEMCNGDLRKRPKVRHTSMEKESIQKNQSQGVQTMPKASSHDRPQAPPRRRRSRSTESDASTVDRSRDKWSPEAVMESILEQAGCEADDFQDFFLYHSKALGRPVNKTEVSCSMTKGVGIGEKAFVKTKTKKMDVLSRSVQTNAVVIEEVDEEAEEAKLRRAQSPPIGKNESVTSQVKIDEATLDGVSLHEFNTLERHMRIKPGQDHVVNVEEPNNYTERVQEWYFDTGTLKTRKSRGDVVGETAMEENEETEEEAQTKDTDISVEELVVEEPKVEERKHTKIYFEEATQTEESYEPPKPAFEEARHRTIIVREPQRTETAAVASEEQKPTTETDRVQEYCYDTASSRTKERRGEMISEVMQGKEIEDLRYDRRPDPSVPVPESNGCTDRHEDWCYDQGSSMNRRERLDDVVGKPVMLALERDEAMLKTTAAQIAPTYFPLRYEAEEYTADDEDRGEIPVHDQGEILPQYEIFVPEVEPIEVVEDDDEFAERVHESHTDSLKTRTCEVEMIGEPDTNSTVHLVAIKNENPTNFTTVQEEYFHDYSKQQFSTLERKERTRPPSKIIETDIETVLSSETLSESPSREGSVVASEGVRESDDTQALPSESVQESELQPAVSSSTVSKVESVSVVEEVKESDAEPDATKEEVITSDVKATKEVTHSEHVVESNIEFDKSGKNETESAVEPPTHVQQVAEMDKESLAASSVKTLDTEMEAVSSSVEVAETNKASVLSGVKVIETDKKVSTPTSKVEAVEADKISASSSVKITETDKETVSPSAEVADKISVSSSVKVTETDKEAISSSAEVADKISVSSSVKVTETSKEAIPSSAEAADKVSISSSVKVTETDKESISSSVKPLDVNAVSSSVDVAETDKVSVSSVGKVSDTERETISVEREAIPSSVEVRETDIEYVAPIVKPVETDTKLSASNVIVTERDKEVVLCDVREVSVEPVRSTEEEVKVSFEDTNVSVDSLAAVPPPPKWNENADDYVIVEEEHFDVESPPQYSTLERKQRTKPHRTSVASSEGADDTFTEHVEESHYDLGMGSLTKSKGTPNGTDVGDPITRSRTYGEVFGEPDVISDESKIQASTSTDYRRECDLLEFYRKAMQEEEKSLDQMLRETRSKSPSPEGNPGSKSNDVQLTTTNVESQADLQNYINIALASIQSAKEKIEQDVQHARQVQHNMKEQERTKQASASTGSLPGAKKVNPFEMCKPPAPSEKAQATYLELDPLHPDNVDLLIESLTTPVQSPSSAKSLNTTTDSGIEQDVPSPIKKPPPRSQISIPVSKLQYTSDQNSPKPIKVANFRTPLQAKNTCSHERTEVTYEGDQAKPFLRRGSSVSSGSRHSINKISREGTPELTENLSYHRSTSHPEAVDLDKLSRVINEQFSGKENYQIDADKALKRRKLQKPKLSVSKDSSKVITDVALFKKAIQPHNSREGALVCEEISTEEVTLTIKYPKGVYVPSEDNIFRDIIHHRVTKIRGPSEDKEVLSAIESSQDSDQKDSREEDDGKGKTGAAGPKQTGGDSKKAGSYTC